MKDIENKIGQCRYFEKQIDHSVTFRDADTVLQDIIDEIEPEVTGTGNELFELYENINNMTQTEVFENLFETLLGTSFAEYVDRTLDVLKSQVNDPNTKTLDNGITITETKIKAIYTSYWNFEKTAYQSDCIVDQLTHEITDIEIIEDTDDDDIHDCDTVTINGAEYNVVSHDTYENLDDTEKKTTYWTARI